MRRRKYLSSLLVTVLILIVVLLPGSAVPDVEFIGFDKLVHFGLFGLWSFAVFYDFKIFRWRYLIAFQAGAFFSLFTEFLQLFVEDRTFDLFDFVADCFGLIVGLSVSKTLINFLKRIPVGHRASRKQE